jgi:hypothetical protein
MKMLFGSATAWMWGCQIWRHADQILHLGQRYKDMAARDADPNPEADTVPGVRQADRADDGQCGADGPFGIVFVRLRISEQGLNAVADNVRNETADLADRSSAGLVIILGDVVQVFELERAGERRRADHVAEENREVASLCG